MPHNNKGAIQRTPPATGIMPRSAADDPQLLARMATDANAANEIIEDLVWQAIYYAKSASLYEAGPKRAPGISQNFLDSTHAICRRIAQHVLRAYQEGHVRGQNEGRGYAERQKSTLIG